MPFRIVGFLIVATFLCAVTPGQSGENLPPPLSIHAPFDAAWKAMLETLELHEFQVAQKEQSSGKIQTRMHEYISGTLAPSHVRKIAERVKLADGQWTKAQYRYEVQIQFHSETETVILVDTTIRGRKRSFLGEEEWIQLDSNGRLEEDLLTKFGKHLFGETFALDKPRQGYWKQKPGYVPEAIERPSVVVGPERRP